MQRFIGSNSRGIWDITHKSIEVTLDRNVLVARFNSGKEKQVTH